MRLMVTGGVGFLWNIVHHATLGEPLPLWVFALGLVMIYGVVERFEIEEVEVDE